MRKTAKNLFTKNGRVLKKQQDIEAITTLGFQTTQKVESITTIEYATPDKSASKKPKFNFINYINPAQFFQTAKNEFATLKKSRVSLLPSLWLTSNLGLTALILFLLFSGFSSKRVTVSNRYSIFSSKPLKVHSMVARLFGDKSEGVLIDKVFESYNCPLTGTGETIAREAKKNNIPYWIVAAISFQESNCGKKTPRVDGEESYNAWGWGVWGTNVKTFDSWEDGIAAVSRYLSTRFYSQGITDPCDIMKIYTPPSDGSWCEGVKYFGNIIQNYQSPDNY